MLPCLLDWENGVRVTEKERKWRLPGLLHIDGVRKEVKMGKEGSELPGGWERVKIAWPLVCR